MPRKESEPVSEGNGPVPQQEEFGSGELTLVDVYRLFKERFDKQLKIWRAASIEGTRSWTRWRMIDEV